MSYEKLVEKCKELLRHDNSAVAFKDELSEAFYRGKVCTIRELELARYVVVLNEATDDKYVVKNTSNFSNAELNGTEFVIDVKYNVANTNYDVFFFYLKNN